MISISLTEEMKEHDILDPSEKNVFPSFQYTLSTRKYFFIMFTIVWYRQL